MSKKLLHRVKLPRSPERLRLIESSLPESEYSEICHLATAYGLDVGALLENTIQTLLRLRENFGPFTIGSVFRELAMDFPSELAPDCPKGEATRATKNRVRVIPIGCTVTPKQQAILTDEAKPMSLAEMLRLLARHLIDEHAVKGYDPQVLRDDVYDQFFKKSGVSPTMLFRKEFKR